MLPPAVAGIGLIVAFGRVGLLGSTFDALGINVSFNQAAVVLAICARRRPVLRPAGDRVVRGGRHEPDRRVAHARRGLAADVLQGHAAARAQRARGRRGDLHGPRARRVRRDDHVRGQPAGAHADAAARRLHDVRGAERPRRRARDQRAARDHQPRDPDRPQGERPLGALAAAGRSRSPGPSRTERVATLVDELRAAPAVVRARRSRSTSKAPWRSSGRRAPGKTSVLRAVAGLVKPASRADRARTRDVWFDSAKGLFRKPDERRVGLVFQEYALFPHMNVRENVAYAGESRADEYLERFRISHLAKARADRALGRRAPARRTRPRACARSGRAAARRAALGARRAHEGRGARRAPGAAARVRPADAARHARLRGRSVARRPGRRARRRQAAAARDRRRSSSRIPADGFVASFTGANLLRGTRAQAGGRPDARSSSTAARSSTRPITPRARSASSSTRGMSRSGASATPTRR